MRKLELTDLGILNLILELDPALAESLAVRIENVRNAAQYKGAPGEIRTPLAFPGPPQVAPMPQVEYRRPGSEELEDQIVVWFRNQPAGQYAKSQARDGFPNVGHDAFETAFARAQTQGRIVINGKRGPGAKYSLATR